MVEGENQFKSMFNFTFPLTSKGSLLLSACKKKKNPCGRFSIARDMEMGSNFVFFSFCFTFHWPRLEMGLEIGLVELHAMLPHIDLNLLF